MEKKKKSIERKEGRERERIEDVERRGGQRRGGEGREGRRMGI